MMGRIVTCSLAEALYLLGRSNRVVRVGTECTWPYGFEECAIIFEGETAEADHERYIAHSLPVNLCALPDLFAAVAAVLPKGGAA
jgi:hypothetical protein